jgi:RNA-directed DNA polymerase
MNKRVLSKWLRSGLIDRGVRYPTETGVPQGGIISPVISNRVLDGLESVVHGGKQNRRRHHINHVRWADDFMVTANSREVLEEQLLPHIEAFLEERGVRLSAQKTLITPLSEGFDFLGQTLRKFERPNPKPAKLQITPSKASFQGLKTRRRTRCKQAKGATPEALIDTLNPLLRGWANYHRPVIGGGIFARTR